MDKNFHLALYWMYDYLSMLQLMGLVFIKAATVYGVMIYYFIPGGGGGGGGAFLSIPKLKLLKFGNG